MAQSNMDDYPPRHDHNQSHFVAVVNDSPFQLNLLSSILEKAGFRVQSFILAEEALDYFALNGPPDIIITDLYMPGIDGWRFCRLLRSSEFAELNQVPIMIVSGTYSGDDAARITSELGANAFLSSPVMGGRLVEQTGRLIRGECIPVLPKVLIVDDSKSLVTMLQDIFNSNGYEADIALTGSEARARLEQNKYDLVILDYHLPDIMGDELLAFLRRSSPDSVCIMITTDPRSSLATRWMKVGAAAYVRKPFDPSYLMQLCENARRERALLRVEDILEQRTREIRASEERSCMQRAAIAELVLHKDIISSDPGLALPRFVKVCAETINVDRAGIWLFSSDDSHLCCKCLYEAENKQYSSGQTIEAGKLSNYFQAILREGRIYAENARTDPRTRERAEHLDSSGITSILDAGIVSKGRLMGVLCLEHTGFVRSWCPDEEVFAGTIATMVAQMFANAERKQAIAELKISEEKYRELFENAPVGIFQSTPGGRFLSVNPEYARMAGYDSPEQMMREVRDIGKDIYVEPDVREHYRSVLENRGFVNNYEALLKRRNGDVFWVSMSARIRRSSDGDVIFTGYLADITKRKQSQEEKERLEAQLQQSRKMEALGTLAGGIAHDFNNILQAISGYTQLLLAGKSPDHPDIKALSHIDKYSERAKALISQMLTFSRRTDSLFRPVSLNREILDTHSILLQTLPRMIRIELDLDQSLQMINADPVYMQQVILNLSTNAADAMPDGGLLRIRTRNLNLGEDDLQTCSVPKPGDYVLLQISDTGIGMDQEIRVKAFDPFFTTKPLHKGTGLGLTSVYGIVTSHNGSIDCKSILGEGTVFDILFPALDQSCIILEEEQPDARPHRGNETILVVDDEEPLLDLSRELLKELGYSVLCASSGEEALEIYSGHENISLVLMDINMPGMGGFKSMQEILKIDPQARILICSGYAPGTQTQDSLNAGAAGFIGKPYRIAELTEKIRQVLDGLSGSRT